MKCYDLRREILLYAEGESDHAARQKVSAHLRTCGHCGETAESLRELTLAIRELRDEAAMAPDELVFASAVRRKALETPGFTSLLARGVSWVEEVSGPLIEQPVQVLVPFGLVLWLAGASVVARFGLERIVARLTATLLL